MADYIGITESQSDPFAPLTSELVKQLRDNPIAIAEGADGAPLILDNWHPYDATEYRESNGLLYDHSVDGDVSEILTPVFTTGYEYRIVSENLRITSGLEIALRETSNGNFVTTYSREVAGTIDEHHLDFVVKTPWLIQNAKQISGDILIHARALGLPNIERVDSGFVRNDAGKTAVDRVRLRTENGTLDFTDGKVWLFKRRVEGFDTAI